MGGGHVGGRGVGVSENGKKERKAAEHRGLRQRLWFEMADNIAGKGRVGLGVTRRKSKVVAKQEV